MPKRSPPQSVFRHPLTVTFASPGAVRVLRELSRHGGELSVSRIADQTQVTAPTVRAVLGELEAVGLIESIGQGRTVLYRLSESHPLTAPLVVLFQAEAARVDRVYETIRTETAPVHPRAIWLYGSTARAKDTSASDLDVALVLDEAPDLERMTELRAHLADRLEHEGVRLSLVDLSTADVARLVHEQAPFWQSLRRDAVPLLGPPPDQLAAQLKRTA